MNTNTSVAIPNFSRILVPAGHTYVAVAVNGMPFVARDHFILNAEKDGMIKISRFFGDFEEWFLGKREVPFTGSVLQYQDLYSPAADRAIVAELGGEEKAETSLAELFALLQVQPNREKEKLLIKIHPNVFYIKDVSNVLRAISVSCYEDGWCLYAVDVESPIGRSDGSRVFSRVYWKTAA
jgi:hypothetical protein